MKTRLLPCALALLATSTATTVRGADAPRPNIVFILTDDLGYGDVGAFFQNQRQSAGKASHRTPHLDGLAAEGTRLTHHYCSAPVCAPSRASLLSGVHQGHANIRDNQFDKELENNHNLATVLRQGGYATAAIGKWGLQGKPQTTAPDWPAHPLNRGFDFYFGYIRHVDGHEHYPKEGPNRGPKEVWENRTEISAGLDKCYTADLFTARAKKWIVDQRAATPGKPFFLYLAFDTPHATTQLPTQAYPEGGGLKGGLQWLGEPGRMINTASGQIDSWYHPDYAKTDWPDVYKRYATSVRRIDDAVGDLVQTLKELKIDENTIIVFTSDNGPSVESYLANEIQPEFFGSYGPFDGIKRDCWEGGTRVPTIVRWPAAVKPGQVSPVPSSFPDWMPTFAQAAGLPAPARSDGVSLLPTLTGNGTQQTPRVYIEYFEANKTPNFAAFEAARRGRVRKQMQLLRLGDHVGVRYNITEQSDDFEIYNAVTDPKQASNLAGTTETAQMQQEMKQTVLRLRRPDPSAPRPYDNEPMPAVTVDTKPGLNWTTFAGTFPWVPQVDGLTPASTGRRDTVGLNDATDDGCVLLSGFVQAPTEGTYTFYLKSTGRAEMRVHEATVIDSDHDHKPDEERSAMIVLSAGLHPVRLTCLRPANSKVELMWSGPGIEKQPVPASAWFAK